MEKPPQPPPTQQSQQSEQTDRQAGGEAAEHTQQPGDEDSRLRTAAMKNAESIFLSRRRSDDELIRAKEALEWRTEELAHSLAAMKATLEATTDSILVTDVAGNVTGSNEKFMQMWEVSRDLIAAGDHQQVLDATSRQFSEPQAYLDRVAEIYASWPTETFDVLELVDGRVIERFTRLQFVDERNAGRVWSFRDITESRRVEEALRDETRVLELLNKTGAAIASTLDLQKLLQTITDATTQLSGAQFGAFFYNTTDENGDAFLLHTLSGLSPKAFEHFGQPRATPLFGPTFRGESPIRLDDVLQDERYGQWAPHHGMPPGHAPVRSYLAVPVISRSGETIGGLFFGHGEAGVFSERSERLVLGVAAQAAIAIDNARLYDDVKRVALEREQLFDAERAARAEAERVGRMKDEFLATLSHELRTPLNAILGWSHILLSGKGSPEDFARGLETIARNARAQTQLIEDLLDMNRIVSGKVRLDVQPADLVGVVEAALDSVRPSAESKEIRLQKIIDPAAGPVSGDPNRLQQVIWNLLSNAVKFTPRGGTVAVILARVNSHIEITVTDSGVGISAGFLPHVFDRFRQADSSTTRHHGGLGLGLSIVKQLVELHGGTVRAESQGEDKGASFVVSLPVSAVRAAERSAGTPGDSRQHPASSHMPFAQAVPLDGVRILVIDDEPDARDLIKRVLLQCRAEVSTAASASEAMSMLVEHKPDVIVSDIGMPQKDGYQFIREVRSLSPANGGRTPAIALTAFARSEDRTRAMIAGYQVHISKPIEPQELIATVASLAGRMGSAESLPEH
ncbi:MAG: two-component hybrid sensor and regulator [Rhodocyclales bacterium]|nr:two-component hybrid sensor and regulator [Rhodocyclales bacterium]